MTRDVYRQYFDIDPEYFPVVNEDVINKNPEVWKKFYPHATFINLLKDTISVLQKKQRRSIWVEGAYGTGKSHAVLTLKKLLDASESETRDYFERFELDNDLFNKFQGAKNSGEILTVHRYGSSSIRNDQNLVFALQESIEKALEDKGIQNKGQSALRDSVLAWLSDPANKSYFNDLATGAYANLFGGDDADAIIANLSGLSGNSLLVLMEKIFKVADERQIKALSLDTTGLVAWIKEIIQANNLKAIVFIWDEFTEFFNNNARSLTGFQEIVELSETEPFYMIIVTHKSAGLFHDGDKDKSKILDRFIKPTCIIELPENMAFQLMGAAMEKNKDQVVLNEWKEIVKDLDGRTYASREIIKAKTKISNEELKAILPIHPYAALMLKHISSAFDSNQRSMFDFIKNDRGDEIKGFQWFIDTYGPFNDNPLLTVDQLWDFFYEKGKEHLSRDIRSILDYYSRAIAKQLNDEEKRVLKTTLLLQAISQKVGDAVELFIPNDKNINNAFEGSDLDSDAASRCARKLVRDDVLFIKKLGGGKSQYSALISGGDFEAVKKHKEEVEKTQTAKLIKDGALYGALQFTGVLSARYELAFASASDFDRELNNLCNKVVNHPYKIPVIVTLAKNDDEGYVIEGKIRNALKDGIDHMVFIDGSLTPLGRNGFEQYCENMAQAKYYQGKDNDLLRQYEANAIEVLEKWKNRISKGEFKVYTMKNPEGERVPSADELLTLLSNINRDRFKNGLESKSSFTDTMYNQNALKLGVECGATQVVRNAFKPPNENKKPENVIGEAWKYEGKYWEDKPELLISKIKIAVEDVIQEGFATNGRASMMRIYDVLKAEPFGFMPCNLSAFVLGFILKEYVDGTYTWSNDNINEELTVEKLQDMVVGAIRLQATPNPKSSDQFIVIMTKEQKSFNEATSIAFDIDGRNCTSVEQTRGRIRGKMKEYTFPIWTIKSILGERETKTDHGILKEIIDYYVDIAKSDNMGDGSAGASDIATKIGKLCLENKDVGDDLRGLFNKETCTEGMIKYLKEFNNGELSELAKKVGDGGQYINALRNKFDANEANWVWNKDTVQEKIREVILEYKIILESQRFLPGVTSFKDTVRQWCEKCGHIGISFEAAKGYTGGMEAFLELLHQVVRSVPILPSQKEKFYDLLVAYGDAFSAFYSDQVALFKRIYDDNLEDFSNEEIKQIYNSIGSGSFTAHKAMYDHIVMEKVEEYKINSKSAELKRMWRDGTDTESPREWSKKYHMPILSMIDDEKIQEAKTVFRAINVPRDNKSSIDEAIDFLKNGDLFSRLNDEAARERAFKESIIKGYDVMLPDIEEVKHYLESVVTVEPYDWFALPVIEKKIKELAEEKYKSGGSDKAMEKIDRMELSEVKRDLKDLIKNDLDVGMAIIKEN